MKNSFFKSFVSYIGRKVWARTRFGCVGSFVGKGERIVDIGAGVGWVGELLKEQKGADVTLLDVQDFNQSKLSLVLYDGKGILLADIIVATDLLLLGVHHWEQPGQVVKAAMRVSRRVIILEDNFHCRFERTAACINDIVSNLPSFFISKKGTNLPFHFQKVSEWQSIFGALGIKLVHIEQKQLFYAPLQRTLFVLEKR